MAVALMDEGDLRRLIREELIKVLDLVPNRADLPPVLTVAQAAKLLGVSRSKMYDIVRQPGFPRVRIENMIRIPTDAFLQWMKSQGHAGRD